MNKYVVMYYNTSLFNKELKIAGFYKNIKDAEIKLKELKNSKSIIYDAAFIIKLEKSDGLSYL